MSLTGVQSFSLRAWEPETAVAVVAEAAVGLEQRPQEAAGEQDALQNSPRNWRHLAVDCWSLLLLVDCPLPARRKGSLCLERMLHSQKGCFWKRLPAALGGMGRTGRTGGSVLWQ